jgi:hypothetical protein
MKETAPSIMIEIPGTKITGERSKMFADMEDRMVKEIGQITDSRIGIVGKITEPSIEEGDKKIKDRIEKMDEIIIGIIWGRTQDKETTTTVTINQETDSIPLTDSRQTRD